MFFFNYNAFSQGNSNCAGSIGGWNSSSVTAGGQVTNFLSTCPDARLGLGTSFPQKQLHIKTSHVANIGESHNGIRLEHSQPGNTKFTFIDSRWDIVPEDKKLYFIVPGTTTSKTILTLTDTGNVGIGTTLPKSLLHVSGTNRAEFILEDRDEAVNNKKWRITNAVDVAGHLQIQSLNDDNTVRAKVIILGPGGNVGIGVLNPQNKLEAAGAIKAEGFLAFKQSGNPLIGLQSDNFAVFGMQVVGDDRLRIGSLLSDGANPVINDHLVVKKNGNVGIGTTSPSAKLTINGAASGYAVRINILNFNDKAFAVTDAGTDIFRIDGTGRVWAKRTTVQAPPFPDYVFEKSYKLLSIPEFKKYIYKNKQLPGMPSAKEVEKNGLDLGDVSVKLTENVEVLGLYVIELHEEVVKLKEQNKVLQVKLDQIENKE